MTALLPLPYSHLQGVSSEKLPDTPKAGPTTSEALKHEQGVPSVPCTTATTTSVFHNSDCSAPLGARNNYKNRSIPIPSQGSSSGR